MGSVFAAYDQQLDRRVALKLLHQRTEGNALQRQRTLHEARAVARISHPNVISVYDVGEADGHIYIAMEYVDGETLAAWQARRSHPWREILDRYLQAGAGLQAAHEVGVVHRDFKPENVLCSKDGRLRVADFGVARIGWTAEQAASPGIVHTVPANEDSPGRLTQRGVISGTPGYMSPEQYRSGNVDSRSDQWSFCAALFEALYGRLPFDGETLRERAENVHGPPLPPPRNTQVPEEVHRALPRGLAVDPNQRFPSTAELLGALALEQGDHAAGRTLSRNRLLRWFVGMSLVGLALVQLRQAQRSLNPRDMLIAASLVLIATLSFGILFRKTLLDNRFHRSMWFLCIVNQAIQPHDEFW